MKYGIGCEKYNTEIQSNEKKNRNAVHIKHN